MSPIERAVALHGSQVALAAAAGVTGQAVSAWVRGARAISASSARAIEKATAGAVTRYELAPDLFDDNEPIRPRRRTA